MIYVDKNPLNEWKSGNSLLYSDDLKALSTFCDGWVNVSRISDATTFAYLTINSAEYIEAIQRGACVYPIGTWMLKRILNHMRLR